MEEILERLNELIYSYDEDIAKLDELAEMYPEMEANCMIKKEAIEEAILNLKEIIEDFSDINE